MSKVCYFASDAKLKGKENPYVKLFSIREALAAGIDLDMDFLEGINQDEPGVIAWCESEENFQFPSIWIGEPYDQAPKSTKTHYAEIGGNPLMDLPGILAYIQQHMDENPDIAELELWDVWIGHDKQDLAEVSCPLRELTVKVLEGVFDEEKTVDVKLTIVR